MPARCRCRDALRHGSKYATRNSLRAASGVQEVVVTYQIFAESEDAARVPLPAFQLKAGEGAGTRIVDVPARSFLLSPGLPPTLTDEDRELRPSPEPKRMSQAATLAAASAKSAVAFVCAAYLTIDELRAQAALAAEPRFRRRDDERAPRRVRRLPPEPAAARGLPARRDAARVGRAVPAAVAAAAGRARRRGDGVARGALSRAGSGSVSRPARCRSTSRSWT